MMIFEETQRVGKVWRLTFLVLLIISMILFAFVNEDFVLGIVIFSLFFLLSFTLKLEVKIYEETLMYRLLPFNIKNKRIKFNSIQSVERLTPKQIGVFGFKIKHNSRGAIYYFGGNELICIKRKHGKDILLGTHKIKAMQEALILKSV